LNSRSTGILPTHAVTPAADRGTGQGVRLEPYRWRLSGSFAAHLFKATVQQHHRDLAPTIDRFVPEAGVVFDIGAHAGQYTKLFARAASHGRVYAFEPGSYARAILRTVVGVRRLANVSVMPMALGGACGVATLSMPVKRGGSFGFGLSHLGRPHDRWSAVAQELVGLATLDAVAAALDLDRLDLIKADIEGSEMGLLRGGEETLRRFHPILVIELVSEHLARAGDRVEDAFAFLAGLGYTAFDLTAEGELVPAPGPRAGEFWFFCGGDPQPAIG
jgi:FkbM family methyltransferase